ncbi:MAG TPA: hypothetical protein VF507_05685 [Pyrinomonadaceae bacterium]|jgi:hypothetical protein
MAKRRRRNTEEEIDDLVISQADDDSAWEEPISVGKSEEVGASLRSELAARAARKARGLNESLSRPKL